MGGSEYRRLTLRFGSGVRGVGGEVSVGVRLGRVESFCFLIAELTVDGGGFGYVAGLQYGGVACSFRGFYSGLFQLVNLLIDVLDDRAVQCVWVRWSFLLQRDLFFGWSLIGLKERVYYEVLHEEVD